MIGGQDEELDCPHCHQKALVLMGDRKDLTHQRLHWAVVTTHIFVCSRCAETVEIAEVQRYRPGR